MKGELFLFLRKGEDIPVFDGEFTIENHYEFLSSVWIYGCYPISVLLMLCEGTKQTRPQHQITDGTQLHPPVSDGPWK